MKARLLEGAELGGDARAFIVVLDPGEEAFSELSAFARERGISAAQVTAVGAFSNAVVGWFDPVRKRYRRIGVDEQCEVLSLVGDVARSDEGPQLHLHAVLGLSDGSTRGGHFLEGRVWPTLEVIFRESPAVLCKTHHPEFGLALIDVEASESGTGNA